MTSNGRERSEHQPSPRATSVISVAGLHKWFGQTHALDGLDLEVRAGEVHGFLGPNGAGKSTTVRMLLGLLRADSGQARVLGGEPWRDTATLHRRIAYCPGDVSLWPNLSGGEVIDLFGRLRGDLDKQRRDQLLDRFELDPKKKGRSYSKGNRQKVAIVAALASDAELLILDEPTTGLDPIMEAEFQRTIHEIKAEGRTVLLSSHILSEVEALCDRVTIIRAGRSVESGTLQDLRHLTRTTVTATLSSDPHDFGGGPGVHDLVIEDHKISMSVESDAMNSVLKLLTDHGIESLKADPPTLEELFLRHYADELQ